MTVTSPKGTGCYMAPEMWDPNTKATLAVDVYGLGMILYELLTRRMPIFPGTSETGNRPKIPTSIDECPSIRDCPDGYIDLMTRCWDQDPTKRPKINDALSQLLRMRRPLEFEEFKELQRKLNEAETEKQLTQEKLKELIKNMQEYGKVDEENQKLKAQLQGYTKLEKENQQSKVQLQVQF